MYLQKIIAMYSQFSISLSDENEVHRFLVKWNFSSTQKTVSYTQKRITRLWSFARPQAILSVQV